MILILFMKKFQMNLNYFFYFESIVKEIFFVYSSNFAHEKNLNFSFFLPFEQKCLKWQNKIKKKDHSCRNYIQNLCIFPKK